MKLTTVVTLYKDKSDDVKNSKVEHNSLIDPFLTVFSIYFVKVRKVFRKFT